MTLRLTEEELAAINNRRASFTKRCETAANIHQRKAQELASKARSETPKKYPDHHERTKSKNGLEATFAALLEARKQAGELAWYAYEPFRIRLADGCFYRPDFVTVDMEGRTEVYEVKGFMREAARLRLKIATEKLPYPFYIVLKHKGELRVTKV